MCLNGVAKVRMIPMDERTKCRVLLSGLAEKNRTGEFPSEFPLESGFQSHEMATLQGSI